MQCPSLRIIARVAPDALTCLAMIVCLAQASPSRKHRSLRPSHYATSPGICAMHGMTFLQREQGQL